MTAASGPRPQRVEFTTADPERTPSAPLRFLSVHPASAAARTQWLIASDYLDRLLANPRKHLPARATPCARASRTGGHTVPTREAVN